MPDEFSNPSYAWESAIQGSDIQAGQPVHIGHDGSLYFGNPQRADQSPIGIALGDGRVLLNGSMTLHATSISVIKNGEPAYTIPVVPDPVYLHYQAIDYGDLPARVPERDQEWDAIEL